MATDSSPKGNPLLVMAIGAFLGGLFAGANNGGVWTMCILSAIGAVTPAILGGGRRPDSEEWLGLAALVIGLSTLLIFPCGFIGLIVGKALWGS